MSQPFIGEIRMFAGNFAPAGWMFCEGQLLPISENGTLFNLIGTTYGGDGQETFCLPDMRGRVPIHIGNGFTLAETGGVETVTLAVPQIASHTHPFVASVLPSTDSNPRGRVLAQTRAINLYTADNPTSPLSASALAAAGGNQPHSNFQPYLCVNFIISLFGVFPSQT